MRSKRNFNQSELSHRQWTAQRFGLQYAPNAGIDIFDDEFGIELKCRHQPNHPTFTIHAYQINDFPEAYPEKELFWGFLVYSLSKTPAKIKGVDITKLVIDRQLWIFEWDWVKQFPVSEAKTGHFVYVKREFFPPNDEFNVHTGNQGNIYLPHGCSLEKRL